MGVNHEFQPYNNIIINIIIEIFFLYSMRFRFTEYLNTLRKKKRGFSLAGTGRFVSFAV